MRRALPLAAILAIPLGAHASATASSARPTPVSAVVSQELMHLEHAGGLHTGRVMQQLHSSQGRSLARQMGMIRRLGQPATVVRQATGHARSHDSGPDLSLPGSLITSGNGTQGTVVSGQGPFKVFHSSWSGYVSGVAASFNFEPIFDLFYQGSVFTDAASAKAYMSDSYNHLTSGNSIPPTDCSSAVGYPCQIIGYVTTDNQIAVYQVAQVNFCVIETGIQGDPTQIQANQDTVTKAAAGVFSVGVTEAAAACTSGTANPQPTAHPTSAVPTPRPTEVPTTLEVIGCFQKNGTQPSANPTCLHKAKQGQKLELEVYTKVDSAPVGSSATVKATIKRGSSTLRSGTGSFTTESGQDLYAVGNTWTVPKKKGSYALHVQTVINGVTASDSEKLKVA